MAEARKARCALAEMCEWKMQGEFEKMQRGANCNRAKSGHFSITCIASPYSRSRETVIALAGTLGKRQEHLQPGILRLKRVQFVLVVEGQPTHLDVLESQTYRSQGLHDMADLAMEGVHAEAARVGGVERIAAHGVVTSLKEET